LAAISAADEKVKEVEIELVILITFKNKTMK